MKRIVHIPAYDSLKKRKEGTNNHVRTVIPFCETRTGETLFVLQCDRNVAVRTSTRGCIPDDYCAAIASVLPLEAGKAERQDDHASASKNRKMI